MPNKTPTPSKDIIAQKPKWQSSAKEKSMRAVQVAFEMEQSLAQKIKIEAAKSNMSPSDLIRKLLGLSHGKPKRPRLTISLTDSDYELLAEKFEVSRDNQHDIKKHMLEHLIEQTKQLD